MSEPKEFNVSTKINTLELKSFEVEAAANNKKLDPSSFVYDYVLNVRFELSIQTIYLQCTSKIFTEKEKSNLVGTIVAEGAFEVLNLKDIIVQFEHKIPVTVFAMYVGVLIASMRGFLILKSENTPLQGAIMPIINSQSFFGDQGFIAVDNSALKDE